jgi:hypothetical protein
VLLSWIHRGVHTKYRDCELSKGLVEGFGVGRRVRDSLFRADVYDGRAVLELLEQQEVAV